MRSSCTDGVIEAGPLRRIPVRVYGQAAPRRAAPLVLHLHGGAFQAGSLDTGCTVAALLADAGAVVLSADYPCGRDHPFPEALELVFSALEHLGDTRATWAGKASKLFVAGEEAGGNLAAALAMMARDRQGPRLAGQILLSPMLDPRMATCSVRDAEAGPVGCRWADGWRDYLGSPDKASHPYAAPWSASRLAGLPPALVLTAPGDPMQDESLGYAGCLRDNGVLVQCHTLQACNGLLGDAGGADAGCMTEARAAVAAFFRVTAPGPEAAAAPSRFSRSAS